MVAIIEPRRIILQEMSSLPKQNWENLLDDLKTEHVPAFTPNGKRMAVFVSPAGRVDALIYRTTDMPNDEVVRVLAKHNIPLFRQPK